MIDVLKQANAKFGPTRTIVKAAEEAAELAAACAKLATADGLAPEEWAAVFDETADVEITNARVALLFPSGPESFEQAVHERKAFKLKRLEGLVEPTPNKIKAEADVEPEPKHVVELIRVEYAEDVTLGILKINGKLVCWVLEEPWRDNQQDVSCIPEGEYELEYEYSPSKGRALWTIVDVPGRSYVRIHIGNTVDDTEGCPLTGTSPGRLNGKRAVLGSKKAFNKFMEATESWTSPAKIVVKSA